MIGATPQHGVSVCSVNEREGQREENATQEVNCHWNMEHGESIRNLLSVGEANGEVVWLAGDN